MIFVCRFEPKEKKENKKKSNCNIRTSKKRRKRRKIDIAHEKFHLYCTNQNYKLQYTLDIYISEERPT
jgi:hypothetical protein